MGAEEEVHKSSVEIGGRKLDRRFHNEEKIAPPIGSTSVSSNGEDTLLPILRSLSSKTKLQYRPAVSRWGRDSDHSPVELPSSVALSVSLGTT